MAKPKIAVIGAGLMGHGIAYLFASAGHRVRVQDPSPAAIHALAGKIDEIGALLGREDVSVNVAGGETLAWAVEGAEVVIEAAPERPELKQALFAELAALTPAETILCSNTSVIPISTIAARVDDKSRVLGTHFWNPPHLVPLVEIVLMSEANRPAARRVDALMRAIGRQPVMVNRDIPGFIGNRLQHALKREAIALVASGVCDAETIDTVVKLGFGARMAVLGPLEQSDLVGLDLTKNIHDILLHDLDVTPHTQDYLNDLVAKGETGMKVGKGFRSWTPEQAEATRTRLKNFLAESASAAARDTTGKMGE